MKNIQEILRVKVSQNIFKKFNLSISQFSKNSKVTYKFNKNNKLKEKESIYTWKNLEIFPLKYLSNLYK